MEDGTASGRVSPHHRRRRGIALAVMALVALGLGVGVGAGSGPLSARASGGGGGGGGGAGHGRSGAALPGAARRGGAAISEAAAENAAIDRTLAYTPYVRIAGSQHREVALTFDDGPGPYTPAILGELQRAHAPATFFEVGVEERYFSAATSAIVSAGDPIGDHTESHAPMSHLSRRLQQSQLLEQTAAIGRFGAPFPRLFRPPYGMWDTATLSLLRRYRMLMVLWSVDTGDYRLPGSRAIVHAALAGARPGAIILLHDAGGGRSETVAALPRIIRGLRARGYRLVTVPRLLVDNPAPRDQDVAALAGSGG